MTSEEILKIIAENCLCVRRLPFEVVSYWTYREGDENKKYIDSKGNPINTKKEVVIQDFDLEYFQKTKPSKWETRTPEQRYENFKKNFPNGRKILKETKVVEKGGWYIVKQVFNTDSQVHFSFKEDFLAPTLEGAIELFLKSRQG
jgi:hypothetical protein